METTNSLTVQDVGPATNQPVIRTFSGRYLNVSNPQLDDIDIKDIAHALSHVCRFAGHTLYGLTVAQHCVEMAEYACTKFPNDKALQLAALLHDASEAYICDMPSPIKAILPDYQRIENRLMVAIAFKFNFQWPLNPIIKEIDQEAVNSEWNRFVISDGETWPAEKASAAFYGMYLKISNQ